MYKNELWSLSDKELMNLKYMAIETRSNLINIINDELSRRNKEE